MLFWTSIMFVFWFYGKGKEGREKGYPLLDKDNFNQCNL